MQKDATVADKVALEEAVRPEVALLAPTLELKALDTFVQQ